MFFLRFVAAMAGFGVASVYAFLLTLVRDDRSTVPRSYGQAIHRIMQPLMGLEVEVFGEDNLYVSRPCIYIVNHQSAFDVPILSGIFPPDTVLIAKRELRKMPLFGWIYEATGNIFIDRSNRQAAVHQLREAEEAIRERGVSVWIFPEGTRGSVVGELLPFKKGAFNLAVAAQVPIVPIVVSPVRPLVDPSVRRLRGGTMQIRVLPPVPTHGKTDRDVTALAESTRRTMQETLNGLRTVPAGSSASLRESVSS